MQINEIVNSCSNAHVASAALASIGGDLVERVAKLAHLQGLTPGTFTAIAVRDFGRDAQPEARAVIRRAMCGADQPILRGLRMILESVLEAAEEDSDIDEEFWARRAAEAKADLRA